MKKSLIIAIIYLILFVIISEQVAVHGFLTNSDKFVNTNTPLIQEEPLILISKIIHYSLASPSLLIIVIILSLFLLANKKKLETITFLIGVCIASLSSYLLKIFFHRQRPFNALIMLKDFSYPSGHVLISLVLFGLLLYIFWENLSKKNKLLASLIYTLFIILVSFSRIYLNVHWLSDILGSLTLGIFWLSVIIYLDINIIHKKKVNATFDFSKTKKVSTYDYEVNHTKSS